MKRPNPYSPEQAHSPRPHTCPWPCTSHTSHVRLPGPPVQRWGRDSTKQKSTTSAEHEGPGVALGQSRKPAVRSGAWREPSAALESPWEMGIDEEPPREKHMRLFHCEVNVSEQERKTISVSMSRTSKPTSVRVSHTCRGSDPDTHSAIKEGHALLLRR